MAGGFFEARPRARRGAYATLVNACAAAAVVFAAMLALASSRGSAQILIPACFGSNATIVGTDGNDVLRGTDGNDVIFAGGGDDEVFGLGGDDVICGNGGNDHLDGGDGEDFVLGNEGNDVVGGGNGPNFLFGGPGDDQLVGGPENDWAAYPDANGVVADLAAGGATGEGTDTYTGVDSLIGSPGNDTLIGDANTNGFEGGEGDDAIKGGGSIDYLLYTLARKPIHLDLPHGQVTGEGTDTISEIEGVGGSKYNDRLVGDGSRNVLNGFVGNDTVIAGGGDDVLGDDVGNDTLRGGAGDDTFFPELGNDVLDGGRGLDRVSYDEAKHAISANLARHVATGEGRDRLISIEALFGSTRADRLTGNGGDNVLSGGGGNDRIAGAAGDDYLNGGAGNDALDGGPGDDYCLERGKRCETIGLTGLPNLSPAAMRAGTAVQRAAGSREARWLGLAQQAAVLGSGGGRAKPSRAARTLADSDVDALGETTCRQTVVGGRAAAAAPSAIARRKRRNVAAVSPPERLPPLGYRKVAGASSGSSADPLLAPFAARLLELRSPAQAIELTWRATLYKLDPATKRWRRFQATKLATGEPTALGTIAWTAGGAAFNGASVQVAPGRYAWAADIHAGALGSAFDWVEPHVNVGAARVAAFRPWCQFAK